LSDRELEVLRLVAQGLSNREIGERLFSPLSRSKGTTGTPFASSRFGGAPKRWRAPASWPCCSPNVRSPAFRIRMGARADHNDTPEPYFGICSPIPPRGYAPCT
jgi:hypothetical protein